MSSIRNKSLTTTGKAGGTIQPGSLTEAARKNAVNSQRKFINNVKDRIAEGRYNEVDFTADLRMINKLIGDICKDENKEVTAQSDLDSYFKGASKSQSEMEVKNQIQALQDLAVEIVRAGKNQVKGNRDKVKEKLEEHINDLISSPEDSEESSEKSSVKTSKDNIKGAMILELNNNLTLEVRDEASSESGAKSPKVDQWLFMRLRIHRIVDKPESESVGGAAPVVGGVVQETNPIESKEVDSVNSLLDFQMANLSDLPDIEELDINDYFGNISNGMGLEDLEEKGDLDIDADQSKRGFNDTDILKVLANDEIQNLKETQIEENNKLTQATEQAPSKSSPANAGDLPMAIVESVVEESSQAGVGGGVDTKLKAEMKELLDKAKENGEVSQKESKEIQNTMEAYKTTVGSKDELTKMMAPSKTNLYAATNTDEVGKANNASNIDKTEINLKYKANNKILKEARVEVLQLKAEIVKSVYITSEQAKVLEKLLKEIEDAEAERNKCAKLASLTDEEINLDLKEDKEFKIEMQKFFKTKMGQEALSMFEPEFVDRVTNMYLGGLSLKIVFTELFSKYLKEQNSHQRTGDILDKHNDIVKKQDESKESLDLLTKLLKELNEVQKDDFNLFQDFKILSGKNNTTILAHNNASRILKSLMSKAVQESN
jgi:hypothetical protein